MDWGFPQRWTETAFKIRSRRGDEADQPNNLFDYPGSSRRRLQDLIKHFSRLARIIVFILLVDSTRGCKPASAAELPGPKISEVTRVDRAGDPALQPLEKMKTVKP